MYYSKQQLTNLYKKYFYEEYDEDDMNDYVMGDKGNGIGKNMNLENGTKTFASSPRLIVGQIKSTGGDNISISSINKNDQYLEKSRNGQSITTNISSHYRRIR